MNHEPVLSRQAFTQKKRLDLNERLGLVFAKAIICTIDGEPYYDLGSLDDDGNAYADHISPE